MFSVNPMSIKVMHHCTNVSSVKNNATHTVITPSNSGRRPRVIHAGFGTQLSGDIYYIIICQSCHRSSAAGNSLYFDRIYLYLHISFILRLWNVMGQNNGLSHSLGFKVTHISIVILHSKDELEPLACPLPCQCHD